MGSILKALKKKGRELIERGEERMKICNPCEFFSTNTGQCKKCGCFMAIKSKIKNMSCPIDKW